mmetsp:Transcript_55637/g.76505  ORF Transcript_55637/g.76505 Transcript_55637/m.76505 type:complete len:175 (+) Transcript_55637:1097-1621(+)
MTSSDIMDANNELTNIIKDYQQLSDRFKRINIVNDQVSGWAKRVYGKFGTLTDEPEFQSEPQDIVSIFQTMDSLVAKELSDLKKRREDNPNMDDDADYNDVFNDFATDDFITKNIRVRPTSGVTHADETRDGRQSNVSRNVSGADGGDTKGGDDENQALYHLNLDRKNIKNLYQ